MKGIRSLTKDIATFDFDYLAELDLSSAYYQLPIAGHFRKYLCIDTIYGLLQFTRMPMGFLWSAFALHKSLGAALGDIDNYSSPYADNVYTGGQDQADTLSNLDTIQGHLQSQHWTLNDTKRREPFSEGDILGAHFNLTNKTTEPTEKFREKIIHQADATLNNSNRKKVEQLLGLTAWASQATPSYLYYTHHLVKTLSTNTDSLTEQATEEINDLKEYAYTSPPTPITALQTPAHIIYSDASDSHQAFSHIDAQYTPDHWDMINSNINPGAAEDTDIYNDEVQYTHISTNFDFEAKIIAEKEASALCSALTYSLNNELKDSAFAIDNQPLFYAVTKGRSNNHALHATADLFNDLRQANLNPTLRWIPSKANVADLPTRPDKYRRPMQAA
jgi:hypothetical protein